MKKFLGAVFIFMLLPALAKKLYAGFDLVLFLMAASVALHLFLLLDKRTYNRPKKKGRTQAFVK